MGEDRGNFRDFAADFSFQHSHHVMRVFEAEVFVEFQMLLHVEPAFKVLHAHIMHAEIIA